MADPFIVPDTIEVGTWGCFSLGGEPRSLTGGVLVGTYGHFKQLIGESFTRLPHTLEALIDYTFEVICP